MAFGGRATGLQTDLDCEARLLQGASGTILKHQIILETHHSLPLDDVGSHGRQPLPQSIGQPRVLGDQPPRACEAQGFGTGKDHRTFGGGENSTDLPAVLRDLHNFGRNLGGKGITTRFADGGRGVCGSNCILCLDSWRMEISPKNYDGIPKSRRFIGSELLDCEYPHISSCHD